MDNEIIQLAQRLGRVGRHEHMNGSARHEDSVDWLPYRGHASVPGPEGRQLGHFVDGQTGRNVLVHENSVTVYEPNCRILTPAEWREGVLRRVLTVLGS